MARRLTVHEAAIALSMSPNTVRRKLKRGELRAEREETPQGYVWRVLVDDPPEEAGDTQAAPADTSRVSDEVPHEFSAVRDVVTRLEQQVEALRQVVREERDAHHKQIEAMMALMGHYQRLALMLPAATVSESEAHHGVNGEAVGTHMGNRAGNWVVTQDGEVPTERPVDGHTSGTTDQVLAF
jgi:hypothetical protein